MKVVHGKVLTNERLRTIASYERRRGFPHNPGRFAGLTIAQYMRYREWVFGLAPFLCGRLAERKVGRLREMGSRSPMAHEAPGIQQSGVEPERL